MTLHQLMRPNKAETVVQGLSFAKSLVIFLTHTQTIACTHTIVASDEKKFMYIFPYWEIILLLLLLLVLLGKW